MKVTIERLDHFGRGIAYLNNKITFVNNALPEEIVDIKIRKEKKKTIEATCQNRIEESTKRKKPECPYFAVCGGCNIMHMNYKEQALFKETKVKNIVKKYADTEEDRVHSILPSKEFYYRNKIVLHVKNKKIGLYKDKSNELIEIDKCFLVNGAINKAIEKVKKFVKETKNNIKQIIIRGEKNILLFIDGFVEEEKIKDYFRDINVVANDKILLNNGHIINTLFNKKFIISPMSFYQVNQEQTKKLYSLVIDHLKDKKYNKILDLYCGTGTIGIIASDYVGEVVGIEVNTSSYKDALKNKKLNKTKNISFINGKVEDYIDDFKGIDLIIVDPPRSGLDKHVIEVLKNISPKEIIYVSCDPMTMSRNIKLLSDIYEVVEITPVDMFPNTYHVECVCILNRR